MSHDIFKKRELQLVKTLHDCPSLFCVKCDLQQQDHNDHNHDIPAPLLLVPSLSVIVLCAGVLRQRSPRQSRFHKQEVE